MALATLLQLDVSDRRMDAGHNRSKWRRKCLPYILCILTLLSQTDATDDYKNGNTNQTVCGEHEYLNEEYGVCCDRCSPGYKLTKKCTGAGLRSSCIKCDDGSYQDQTNSYENCFQCSTCKTHEEEKSPCTHKKNRVCGCKGGYYKKIIDRITSHCVSCKKCGPNEVETQKCTEDQNAVCKNKDLYYRTDLNISTPCKSCKDCPNMCTTSTTPRTPHRSAHPTADSVLPRVLIPVLATTLLWILVIFITYVLIRRYKKKKKKQHLLGQSESPDPVKDTTEQCQVLTYSKDVESAPLAKHWMESEQDQALPDCVPREIRTHEFIYFVLDVVPVKRFKELVRRLNVSEQDIDRAERDNRAFVDAQYQMLKIWSENAAGGGRTILPQPLMQELAGRLKDMNLNGCAESIESKYCNEP
ncbi:hypothetical protein NFI96_017321 [Prochilodus magdalenae]|nr:hypothetical protein NFI96_017321 [Prochilodus magdalenae]